MGDNRHILFDVDIYIRSQLYIVEWYGIPLINNQALFIRNLCA